MKKRILEGACPDCGADMVLRDSKYGLFYGCVRFPECKSAHGAHPDGNPLGIPANKETKQVRIAAHDAFDRLWKEKGFSRSVAYKWLREKLNISREECHIGKFDISRCQQVIDVCEET